MILRVRLARELQRYANVVEEELLKAQEEVSDVAVEKLKAEEVLKKQVHIVKVGVRKKKVMVLLFTILKDN